MNRKDTIGSPFSRMLTPIEAFAEAEHKTTLYGLEGLLLGACQILYGHLDIQDLSDLERMEIAAYVRPAISEIEDYLKKKKSGMDCGRYKQ